MNKKSETPKNQSFLLVALLSALIVFAGFRFGYQYFAEKTEAVIAENEALEMEIRTLAARTAMRDTYLEGISQSEKEILDAFSLYSTGITNEKSILFLLGLENTVRDIKIPDISFGAPSLLYSSTLVPQAGGDLTTVVDSMLSFTYNTTYQGLKDSINYIMDYPEYMTIQSLNASFDAETGNLSGSMVIRQFAAGAFFRPYTVPEINGIRIGKDNIFDTSEIWQQ